jgi:hypothetical protein
MHGVTGSTGDHTLGRLAVFYFNGSRHRDYNRQMLAAPNRPAIGSQDRTYNCALYYS